MKRLVILSLCLGLMTVLTGCSEKERTPGKMGNQPASVSDVLQQGINEAEGKEDKSPDSVSINNQSNTESKTRKTSPEHSSDKVDVDLTILSSTMVYSEVYNMITQPEQYIGKTVKMNGAFAYYHDEATDNYYFACIIKDATRCCAQGIEFVLTDDYVFPFDYPMVNEEIYVIGVFDTYQEGSYTYCTLRNAKLL